MRELTLAHEEENHKWGWIISIIIHLLLLLLLLVNFLHYTPSEPGQRGILVSLGIPDAGQETDVTNSPDAGEAESEEANTTEEIVKNSEPVKEASKTSQAVETPRQEVSKVVVEEDKTLNPKSPEISEAEKKRIAEEVETQRKQEEVARKRQEYEDQKKKFGSLLSGKGQGDDSANQGDPTGDPDQSALENLAKGSGKVGGGLSNRGVLYEPTIHENSQTTGTVVIKICVDSNGEVVEAEFTQRGSTTTDINLVKVAKQAAAKYKFTLSDIEKQCGTVTINFIVK